MRNWINQALWTLSVIVCAVSVRSGKNSFVAKPANIIRQVRKTTIQILVVMVFSLIPLGASAITIQNSQKFLVLGNCQLWVFVNTAGNQIQVGAREYLTFGFAEAKALHLQDISGTERDLTPSTDPSRDWSTANIELTCGFASGSVTNLQSNYVAGQTRSGYNSFYASFSYNGSTYTMSVTATGQAAIATTVNPPANSAPTANAGPDQTAVASAATVTLDGSGSTDPDTGDTLTYAWTKTAGPDVTLSSTSAAQPTFIAPTLGANDAAVTLTFSLVVTDDKSNASTADTVSITVNPPENPAAEFEAEKEEIQAIIIQDASRSLRSSMTANQRMTQGARGRFISARQAKAREEDVTRALIPFDVDGNFTLSESGLSTAGNFFQQVGNEDGTYRRLFFGDFDVQHDNDTDSTTATLTGRMAWEQMTSERTMLGYFIGGELATSTIGGSFEGDQDRIGVTAGGYVVHELSEQVYFDGFASVGAGRNNLEMANETLALESEYTTRTATLGGAITGVYSQKGYDFKPELAFSYGKTWLGDVGFTGRAYGLVDNTLSLDAGTVSIASFTFRPEVIIPIGADFVADTKTQFSFAPRLVCEQIKSTTTTFDCGTGGELGFSSTSEDGLSSADMRVLLDRINGGTRSSFVFSVEHKF